MTHLNPTQIYVLTNLRDYGPGYFDRWRKLCVDIEGRCKIRAPRDRWFHYTKGPRRMKKAKSA